MMCVDASVSVKWLLPEPNTGKALALLNAAVASGEDIIAPVLLHMEVANALRKQMVRQGLSLFGALALFQRFLQFPVDLRSPPGLTEEALRLAATYNLPAVYDAHYLALAQHYGCLRWTDDQRLVALASQLPFVRWIGNY